MTDIAISLRRTTLTILAALLIVTAGCTTGISEGVLGSDTTEKNAETTEEITPESGLDLRTISIDEQFGKVHELSDLDGDDPRQNNTVYEPIEFVGQEGRYYNITMDAGSNAEELRLIDPDGEVVAVATGNSTTSAKIELLKLNKTGTYAIHATSVEERDTFGYSLSVNEVVYAGSPENWSKYERYSQFASLSEYYWEEQAKNSDATFEDVNASEDYIVISYDRPTDANYSVQNSNYAFMGRTLIEARNDLDNNSVGLQREEPEEWYPDRIYFKGYNENGDLVETNYVSQRWTAEYMAGGNEETRKYFYKIVGTTKYGPAHNKYGDSEANETVTESTFPYPTYNESYVDFPTE